MPRLIVLLRLLWRCFFCVAAVLLGNVVLLAVPQAREALLVLASDAMHPPRWADVLYVLAVLYWATSAWFVARLLLGRRFPRDSLGVSGNDPFVEWVSTLLPRFLALAATLPVGIATLQANRWLGSLVLFLSLVFVLLLVFRRRFGETPVGGHRTYAEFNYLGTNGRQACFGLTAWSATLMAGLWRPGVGLAAAALWALATLAWRLRSGGTKAASWVLPGANLAGVGLAVALMGPATDEIALARTLGSPAILLYALGSWTLFGGLVLTYLPLVRGWPSLAFWVPPLMLLLLGGRTVHGVAQQPLPALAGLAADADWRADRPTLPAHFARWRAAHPPGEPVYMVAVAGGASRSGYWAGTVLSALEAHARSQGQRFAPNLFVISSVSGGSLGAAAWVADLAQRPVVPAPAVVGGLAASAAASPAGQGPAHQILVRGFLGRDMLSPVVARALFTDLPGHLVPLPRSWTDWADRALGLERSWVLDWAAETRAGTVPTGVTTPARWDRPLTELYGRGSDGQALHLPSLLLNTVRLGDGQRFVQSNMKVNLPGVQDLGDTALDTRQLSLAQAVHNSARFPYVSPPGELWSAEGGPDRARVLLGRLGDGGYHEASGAATLADLLTTLMAPDQDQLRRDDQGRGLWACSGAWAAPLPGVACADGRPASRVVALLVDGAPATFPDSALRAADGEALETAPDTAQPVMLLPELLGPVLGGLSTRTALARLAQQRLSRLVGSDADALIELRMPVWRTALDGVEIPGALPFVAASTRAAEPVRTPASQAVADDAGRGGVGPDGAAETRRTPPALAQCADRGEQPSMTWALDLCSRLRMDLAIGAAMADGSAFGPHPSAASQALRQTVQRLLRLIGGTAAQPGQR